MATLLRVERLAHHYPEQGNEDTLRQISFSVEAGQICAVVGDSGSGKTTLLRLISGLLDATEGAVWLSDQPVRGPAYRLVPGHPDIRTVFQDFALSPNLSVYQNIAHALRAYRRNYREERTQELIERLHLTDQQEQLPATLSGGEKQRVALARALAEEPTLLLMDEPFSQVDPPLKRYLLRQVEGILRETSGTALLVTHDAPDALALADRILVLQRGELVQQDIPQQVYQQPTSPYVAQLMGECSVVGIVTFQRWYPNFATEETTCVGIRPEHVNIGTEGKGINGTVDHSSYRGGYYELAIRVGKNAMVTARSSDNLMAGTVVPISIYTDQVIRFRHEETDN